MLPGFLSWRPWWLRYGTAFLCVGMATGGVGGLVGFFGLPAFLLYMVAIAISAVYGGVGPGLASAALAFFASYYMFLPPYFRFTSDEPWLPLLVSYVGALVLSFLVLRWLHSRVLRLLAESRHLSSDED